MWRQRYWVVIALMVLTAVCCGTNWHVELKRSSGGRISHGDELIADIMPGLHLEGWRRREMAVYQTPSQPGRLCGAVARDGVHVTSELSSSRPDGQSVLLDYCLMVHQAADRATVCLYLRGDMQPLRHSVLLTLPPDCLTPSFRLLRGTLVPEWLRMSSLAQVGIAVTSKDDRSPQADVILPLLTTGATSASPLGEEGYQTILKRMDSQRWLPADNRTRLRGFPVRVESPSGQFLLDAERSLAFISTPRTAGGFAPTGSAIITNGLQADIRDTEATLWASSVDGQPLSRSRRILLTHLTDLQNDGVTFEDAQRRQLVSWGSLPHIMRQGRATVTLRHQFPQRLKAWVLRTDGERLAPWPMTVTSDGDGFRLELSVRGAHGAQMLYEIADE